VIPHSVQARLGAVVLGAVVLGVLVIVQMFEDLEDLEEDEDEPLDEPLEDRPDAIIIPFRGEEPS